MTSPSYAGETNKFAAACAHIKDTASHAGCMIDAIEKDTKATQANTARLKAQEARLKAEEIRQKQIQQELASTKPCIDFLLEKIDAKATTPAELQKIAGGEVTNGNACSVAQTLGFGRKAEIPGATAPKPVAFNR